MPGSVLKRLREQRGWTLDEAADALGLSRGGYIKIERGERGLRPEVAERAARIYGVSMGDIYDRPLSMKSDSRHILPEPNAKMGGGVRFDGGARIPVYGQAMSGEDGEFVLNGNQIADVLAPPELQGVRDAYAVYVVGESMEPRYFAGETVYVNPHLPVRRGDYVVIQVRRGNDETPHGFIKRFISRDKDRVRLEQHNPATSVEFPTADVVSVHRIILAG